MNYSIEDKWKKHKPAPSDWYERQEQILMWWVTARTKANYDHFPPRPPAAHESPNWDDNRKIWERNLLLL